MTTITNLFTKSPVETIVVLIIIIAVIALLVTKKKAGIYAAALFFVSVAQEEWGSDTGKIKFAQVITLLKAKYPIISLFIKEEVIKKIIEDALIEMKAVLAKKKEAEDNKMLAKGSTKIN